MIITDIILWMLLGFAIFMAIVWGYNTIEGIFGRRY